MKIIITEEQFNKLSKGHFVDLPLIDDDIRLELWENNDNLELLTIIIPKDIRKMGYGTEVMKEVIKYGDIVQKPIYLTPDTSYGGSSVNRLIKFYKQFGFTKNKDFSTRHLLVRYPQQ